MRWFRVISLVFALSLASLSLQAQDTRAQEAKKKKLEQEMAAVQAIVKLGRQLRVDNDLKVRQPLSAIKIAGLAQGGKDEAELAALILDELNVKRVDWVADETQLCDVSFKANFKTLGRKCGAKMKAVAAGVAALKAFGGACEIEGFALAAEDVIVTRKPKAGMVVASEGAVVVGLETALTPELVAEGLAREFVSHVQNLRKQADFEVTQRIRVEVACDAETKAALEAHRAYAAGEILADELVLADGAGDVDLNGHKTGIKVEKI